MHVSSLDLDLEAFQGPFDLLLTLVLREEIDLHEEELLAPGPEEGADELLARMLEYRRYRAAAGWMHERLRAESGYRYRAAPLPRHLRRVALDMASKSYEGERL